MIPSKARCEQMWDKYHLPDQKRLHVGLVCRVALFFASRVRAATGQSIDIPLLTAAALLHDIDKAVPKQANEHHPDTGVRLLREAGMGEVADVVAVHSLPAILDHTVSLLPWESKLLFLADKMVKYEILDVDKRFALWRAESLPPEAARKLDEAYPRVKKLEQEICQLLEILPSDVARLA